MTDDSNTEDETVLAAEYALGLLTPGEAAAFEDVLSVDPGMRDQYASWAKNLATLTDEITPVDPPKALEARITDALFGVPEQRSFFSRLGFLGPVFGGLAAAVIVLVVLGQTDLMRSDGPIYVAEIVSENSSLIVQAKFNPEDRSLQMIRTAGVPVEGRSQELWLIAGDAAPVSLGVWPQGQVEALLEVSAEYAILMADGVLAISDEPQGGSPTGAPTGDILAVGPVTLL